MRFSKWHALGNVYLLVERDELSPEQVRAAVGDADGIVQVMGSGHDWADVVIWNSDGSTAEMSGNGTRIAARWLAARRGADRLRIRVGDRDIDSQVLDGNEVEQNMGAVLVEPQEIVGGIEVTAVSVGNPHAVVLGDPAEIERLGPLLETHERFPDRTNVQVVRVDRPGEVTARVWERGVGETSASGTSAVAVAAATHDDGDVLVHFPGGDLTVRLDQGHAYLIGPAEELES
jgi:diaminopimelate epimerase